MPFLNKLRELQTQLQRKEASSWLMFIPVKDEDLTLSRREFKGAIHLRYNWQISDNPSTCVCGMFSMQTTPRCADGEASSFKDMRDLEAEMLKMVYSDVKIEPVLHTNRAADVPLDIQVCGFWERQALPFLTLMGVLPECSLFKASPHNKSRCRTKPLYFTPLIFTTTGEMADEYDSRLAELLTTKKGYNFAVLRFFHFCDHSIVTFTTFLF